jgi:hypothetical protein
VDRHLEPGGMTAYEALICWLILDEIVALIFSYTVRI